MTESAPRLIDAIALESPPAAAAAAAGVAPARAAWWKVWFDPTARKGAVAIFDQAVVSGTSFLTAVIIGRLGSRDMLGVYYLAWQVVLLVQSVQERTISIPYMIYCSRRKGDALAAYTGSALAHQLSLVGLVTAGLGLFLLARALGLVQADAAVVAAALLAALPFMLLRWFRDSSRSPTCTCSPRRCSTRSSPSCSLAG
jgi:hypothetical protein